MRTWGGAALAGMAILISASAASAQQARLDQAQARLRSFTSPTLTRFRSEAEFEAYLEAVSAARRAARQQTGAVAPPAAPAAAMANSAPPASKATGGFQLAGLGTGFAQETPEPPCTDPLLCPLPDEAPVTSNDGSENESIVVTGALAAPSNPSITNNQMRGVDEGDIVKQIGNFLIVLQDGRLFVIDIRAGGAPRLALTDRADVYLNQASAAEWYDEMLVEGDRILVTAYSYRHQATEITIFRLDPRGRLSREGAFLISSDDYYSGSNYATRIVGDNLVISTPYSVEEGLGEWPVVRRWLPEDSREEALRRGTRLFDAARIYRPVRDLLVPIIHTVSVCPLGPVAEGRDLSCRATAFVGPEGSQLYVTSQHAYLWTVPGWEENEATGRPYGRCRANGTISLSETVPAALYRVPVAGGELEVAGARGMPVDQFSLDANDRAFRALLIRNGAACHYRRNADPALSFLNMPLVRFGRTLADVSERHYTALPPTDSFAIANRFTDDYLVYGSLARNSLHALRSDDWELDLPRAFAVPIANPGAPEELNVPHNVIRVERAGDGIVLTGYRDATGLRISYVSLAPGNSRVASTAHLPKRYESEGRSHAFNSIADERGAGMIGLPTVFDAGDSDRYVWRSVASDISYLTLDRRGRLVPAGELEASRRSEEDSETSDEALDYQCDVSCIDWYGNTRPIFTDGRIFGLTGTELVEGRLQAGRIEAVARLNLRTPPPGR